MAGRVSPSTLACPPVDSGSPTPPTSPAPPPTPGTVAADQPKQKAKQLHPGLLFVAAGLRGRFNLWSACCKQDPSVRRSVSVCLQRRRAEPSRAELAAAAHLDHCWFSASLQRRLPVQRPITWFVGDLSHECGKIKQFQLKAQCEGRCSHILM